MSAIDDRGANFSYSLVGTNTLTQVDAGGIVLYHISVSHTGGSVGFLQVYNNGTGDAGAGTPDFTVPVYSGTLGTSGGSNPTFRSLRDIVYGPYGRQMNGGLSYLWAAGGTGTVAHGVNALVDITYRGTVLP